MDYENTEKHLDLLRRRVAELEAKLSKKPDFEVSEDLFRTLAHIAPVSIFLLDEAGKYLYINPCCRNLLGLSEEERLDSVWTETLHADDRMDVEQAWREAVVQKNAFKEAFRLQRTDGTVVQVQGECVPILSTGQNIQGYVGVLIDVTEDRQIEQERFRTQRLRALGDLSAGVSHNLNNLLTGILGPAQLLQMMNTDEQMTNEINTIVDASVRARELVRRLHLSTHTDPDASLREVSVTDAIQEAVARTQPRWKDESESTGQPINLELNLADVPSIRGNLTRLQDIFVNLILNAVDAMPLGGLLKIQAQAYGDAVRVEVTDTGVGMNEEVRDRIFEPFFTTKMTVGAGLGLSTVHKTITGWGGTIDVESAPQQGTTMTLTLPVWQSIVSTPDIASTSQMRSGRLLVVDDDKIVCLVLSRILSSNHEVEAVQDAHQALAQFVAGRFDVAFVDQGMPGLPGHQIAEHFHKIDPHIATVLITGWEIGPDDPRRAPFDFHLQKPFENLVSLNETVRQAITLCDHRKQTTGS